MHLKTNFWVVLVAGLVRLGVTVGAAAVEIEPMRIVPAPAGVQIDANLDDWDQSGWYLAYPSEEVAQDQYAWLYAMYDEAYLYLAAEVGDPTPRQNQASLALWPEPWWGDDVEFRMVLDPEDPETKRELGIYYSEVAERGEIVGTIPEGLTENSDLAFQIWPDRKGYTFEVRIPWEELLPGFQPAPGMKITWTMGVIYGVPGNVTNYGLRAKACGDNSFYSTAGWGKAIFEPEGQLDRIKPPLPTLTLATVVPGAKRLFALEYDLPEDSAVSLVVYNRQGRVVRTLLNAVERQAGHHEEPFDGLADTDLPYGDNLGGPALSDGTYTWKLIASPLKDPVRLEYHMSFSGHGDPPWATVDQTGAWSSVYGYVQDVCSDGENLYAIWSHAEVSTPLLKTTPAGQKLWGQIDGPGSVVATDGKYVYWAQDSSQVVIKRASCDTGRIAPFADGTSSFAAGEPVELEKEVLFLTPPDMSEESRNAGCRGLAIREGRLYVSLHYADRIAIYQADTHEEIDSIPLAKPSGLAFGPDGRLYALTGRTLVKMKPDGSEAVAVVNSGLEEPYGLAIDPEGGLWVTDRGDAQRVLHYDAQGKLLSTIGRYGGRPPAARLDEVKADLRRPAGLCVDFGSVYVAEDNLLNRIVIYSPRGKLRDQWQGYTNGNDSSFVDEENPQYVYVPRFDGLIRYELDYRKKTWKVEAYSEGFMHGQRDRTFYQFAWRMHGRRYLEDFWSTGYRQHMQPTLRHYQGHTYMYTHGNLYYMAGSELFRILMMTGAYNRMWFPDRIVDEALARWPQLDLWTPAPGGHYAPKPTFWWQDNNLNGIMELDEYQVTEREELFRPFGGWWDKDMVFYGILDGWLWRGEPSLDANGLVTYELDQLQRVAPIPVGVLTQSDGSIIGQETEDGLDIGLGWASNVKKWHLVRYDAEGKLIFRVGKKARSYAKPGEMYRSFGFATAPDDWDFVAPIDESGQLLLYTKDGLFITRLPEYDPYRGPEPNENTMWIELFSANIFRVRGFGQPFVRLSDLFRNSIFRLHGLDSLVRAEGSVTVAGATVNQPKPGEETGEEQGRSVALPRAVTPPALDGKVDTWPVMAPLGLVTEPGFEDQRADVRLAYDDQNLYARFEVSDSSPLRNSADDLRLAFKRGDVCEIFLGLDPQADPARTAPVAGDTRILLGQAGDQPFAVVIQPLAPEAPETAAFTYQSPVGSNHVQRAEVLAGAVVKIYLNPNGDGYILEAVISWASLGISGPPVGPVKFDVGMEFGDVSGQFNAVHVSWAAGGPSGMVNDLFLESRLEPARWGEARFAR